MAKITELPVAGPLSGTEPVIVIQDGEARQSTIGLVVEEVAQPFVDEAAASATAFARTQRRNVAVNPALSSTGAATSWQLSTGTVPTYETLHADVLSALAALDMPAPDRAIAFDTGSGLTFAYKNEPLTPADNSLYVVCYALQYSSAGAFSGLDAIVYSPSAGNLIGKTTGFVSLSSTVRLYWVAGQLPASGLVRLAKGNSVVGSGDAQLMGFGTFKSATAIGINDVRLYDFYPDVVDKDDTEVANHKALATAQTNIAANSAAIAALQLAAAADPVLSRPIVGFGDSRIQFNRDNWRTATSSDFKGIPIGGYGWWSRDVTASVSSGAGTLEYRASDKKMRLTLAGDTAGAWTDVVAGYNTLTSGNGTTTMTFPLNSFTRLPVSDQTVDLGALTSMWRGYRSDGALVRMLAQWGWPDQEPDIYGFGGGTEADFLEILPWLRAQLTVPSTVFYQGITNEISAGTSGATIISRMRQIIDTLKADGHEVLIIGNCARWGTAVSTPMTAGQITASQEVRDWLLGQEGFIDLFPPTCDTANLADLRPKAGILADTVHFGGRGAQAVGVVGGTYLKRRYGAGTRIKASDTDNKWPSGFPGLTSGGTGVNGTTITGVVPNGWGVQLVSGTAAVVCSVEERADAPGEYLFNVEITATTATFVQLSGSGATTTLAALGLVVGDRVRFRPIMHIKTASGVDAVRPYLLFTGLTPTTTLEACRSGLTSNAAEGFAVGGPVDLSTPAQAIPTGTINVRPFVDLYVDAGGSLKVALAAKILVA
jgi:hypothetical protein